MAAVLVQVEVGAVTEAVTEAGSLWGNARWSLTSGPVFVTMAHALIALPCA